VVGDKLRIHVTPKEGGFAPADVASEHKDYKYDLVVTLDTPEYGALGSLFSDHAEFFYARPVANIDHAPSNERFGNMNLVDITASSCCEAVYGLCAADGQHFLDPDMATCLLTGIISKTHSFKTATVTPRTLDIASRLMAAGARREDIVSNLYRTRSIAALKLWGRALARIKYDAELRTARTVLVRQDFIHAGAKEEDLTGVVEELIANSPEAEIIALIYEQDAAHAPSGVDSICAIVTSDTHGDVAGMFAALKPDGDRKIARLCFPGGAIVEAEKTVLEAIRTALKKKP
jgi:nanoRNase/pAp phosphatase (c-di-AMP/oligoRNAs hydrolase)